MTAIERAEELLVATEAERASDLPPLCIDILRGYIGAVKALQEEMDIRQGGTERFSETVREIDGHHATCEAIADFERLFPEVPASAD